MRRILVCALLLSAGCADRSFVNQSAKSATPASNVAKTEAEAERAEQRTARDPDEAPETTNYD